MQQTIDVIVDHLLVNGLGLVALAHLLQYPISYAVMTDVFIVRCFCLVKEGMSYWLAFIFFGRKYNKKNHITIEMNYISISMP